MSDPSVNLLSEAELTVIFDGDSTQISDADFDRLVDHYRAERGRWQELEAQGKKRVPKAKVVPTVEDLFS